MVGAGRPAPTSTAARSRGARVPPPVTARLWGARARPCPRESPAHPCLSFPSQGSSATSRRLSEPRFGSAWWCGRAPTAGPVRWQQVTMLMSPPCVYSSPFSGCPCGARPDVGSPRRGLALTEGSAVSAPCQAAAWCPRVLQGCPKACPSPTLQKDLVPVSLLESPVSPQVPQLLDPRLCQEHPSALALLGATHGCQAWPGVLSCISAQVPNSTLSTACPQGWGRPSRGVRSVMQRGELDPSRSHPRSRSHPGSLPGSAPPGLEGAAPQRCCARHRLPGPGSCRSRPWRFLIDGGD